MQFATKKSQNIWNLLKMFLLECFDYGYRLQLGLCEVGNGEKNGVLNFTIYIINYIYSKILVWYILAHIPICNL